MLLFFKSLLDKLCELLVNQVQNKNIFKALNSFRIRQSKPYRFNYYREPICYFLNKNRPYRSKLKIEILNSKQF